MLFFYYLNNFFQEGEYTQFLIEKKDLILFQKCFNFDQKEYFVAKLSV